MRCSPIIRVLAVLGLAVVLGGCLPICPTPAHAAGPSDSRFDRHFDKAAKRFFGRALEPEWLKAQSWVESNFDPLAKSPVGAVGLMQLMPGTSREMAQRLGLPNAPTVPNVAITLGAGYLRRLWDQWTAPRPPIERLFLSFAAYNAGLGHVLAAQRLAKAAGICNANLWDCIGDQLGRVTGIHAEETLNYVLRIKATFDGFGLDRIQIGLGWLGAIVGGISATFTLGKWARIGYRKLTA